MDIRFIPPQQWEEVFELLKEVYKEPGMGPIGGSWTRSLLRKELEAGRALGAYDSREFLMAFILMRCNSGVFDIVLLATRPCWQRRGVMNRLLAHILEQLGKGQEVWLEVHEQNKGARQLYERLGFEVTGQRARYYGDGGSAILYTYGKSSPKPNLSPCPH